MTPGEMAALHARAFTFPRSWDAAEIAAMLTTPGCFAVSAPDGFAIGRVVADEAELLTIAVEPDAQQQGAGTKLLAAFLERAMALGATRAFLEVAATNTAALALYRKAGFTEAGRRPGYYRPTGRPPIDALILEKSLAAQ